jgi:GH24 family phage-related lysozyme (muramidase)
VRAAVEESFVGFTRDLEGAVSHMYLDKLGYVTTGYGNLIDDTASVCTLPWRRTDGSPATRDEVIAAWATVRGKRGQRDPHGVFWTDRGGGVFAQFTALRLDAGGVDRLVRSTMDRNDAALARRYADWETWPACAQMACMSLAWACGSAYDFPLMDAALEAGDFMTASQEIEMTPAANPGNNLHARNEANAILMLNAARIRDYHLDPDLLDWTSLIGVHDLPTLPELEDPPSEPTTLVAVPSEAETGSGGIIHPLRYPDDPPPDDAA